MTNERKVSDLRRRRSRIGGRAAGFCLTIGVLVMSAAIRAAAQGCAMCYQSAAASGIQGREALRHGIAVLFFPAAAVFVGIFGLLYYRRDKSR